MRLLQKVIVAILQLLDQQFSDSDDGRRELNTVKASRPKLYKKAKYEVFAEKLMESKPELPFVQVLKEVEQAHTHRGQ